jgi:hypothetical protein
MRPPAQWRGAITSEGCPKLLLPFLRRTLYPHECKILVAIARYEMGAIPYRIAVCASNARVPAWPFRELQMRTLGIKGAPALSLMLEMC